MLPCRFDGHFGGVGGASWVQLSKTLVGTMSGRYEEATFQKRVAMTAIVHSKSERIDVRASEPVKQLLQEAAHVAHKNVSEFLLDAGIIAANQTLADRTRFELSDEQWLAFQAALDQPVSAKLKPKLKKLFLSLGYLVEFAGLRASSQTGRFGRC